jgi:hypothetical protein
MHLLIAAGEGSTSFADATCDHTWELKPAKEVNDLLDEVDCLHDSRDDTYARLTRVENELDELRMRNHELKELLDHRPPKQPQSHAEHPRSYAATAATAADRPLTSCVPRKDAKAPLAPKIKLGADFVAPSSKSKGKSKADSPLKKDKDRATSPTVTPFMSMDYEDLVDDYEGMSEEEEWDHNRIAAPESNLARQVHAILNDERFSMPNGGSGSSFVEGRVRDITPENPAQFQFAVDALESAQRPEGHGEIPPHRYLSVRDGGTQSLPQDGYTTKHH